MRCLLRNIYCFIWWGQVWANGIVFTHIEPQVYTAANGTEVINIAPLKGGKRTSFNEYSHFNVSEKGLVFVNSRKAVWSQQAGMLAGNPNLSFEVASLIINEVTSPNATRLLGMLEVAGAPASLIVANPWGITCSSCGFINTPYVMLATAWLVTDDKNAIYAYRADNKNGVSNIIIEGKPIKGNLDYLTILTHSLTLNTEIHAKHLQIILGENKIYPDRGKSTKFRDYMMPPPPPSRLDVSNIGGMYANKIIIINTLEGGSINYRGTLQASGPVVIDSVGEVLLQGKIEAQALQVKTPQLYIDKASTINAAYLAIDAPIVKIDGSQIKASHLTMTGHIIENRDSNIEADHLSMSGTNIENVNSNIKADHLTMLASQQIDITGQVQTGKFAQIKTDRLTLNGTIRGTEKLEVQVYEGYDNSQKLISAPQLLLHTGDAYYRMERESTERYLLYKQQHGL
jgi:filamentous hemagglutinin family protein